MLTAEKSMEKIASSTEAIDKSKPQRFPDAASFGDMFRQGDLYIWSRDGIPSEAAQLKKPAAQLAEGTTQGSRHILDSLSGVTMFQVPGDDLQGPWLLLKQERILTHPEHGDVILPPGCYEVTYQRAFADEIRRVLD